MNMRIFKSFLFILVLSAIALSFIGCGKVVPPGKTVMVIKAKGGTKVHQEAVYYAWGRDKVYFVDTRLKSFEKPLKVLCADEINMDAIIVWQGSFNVTDSTIDIIKKKVPAVPSRGGDADGYELSLEQFYKTTMEDILSNVARDVISEYKTDNIREKREEIRLAIKQAFLARMSELNYPVDTSDILLTNLDYPPIIDEMRKAIKDAELQDLENAANARAAVSKARRDAELAAVQGRADLVDAYADAAANKVLDESLTDEVLEVLELETLITMSEGPNNTIFVIPQNALESNQDLVNTLINREAIQDLSKKDQK